MHFKTLRLSLKLRSLTIYSGGIDWIWTLLTDMTPLLILLHFLAQVALARTNFNDKNSFGLKISSISSLFIRGPKHEDEQNFGDL